MSTDVAFKKMIPLAGFVATSAALGISARYSADRAYEYIGLTKTHSKSSPTIEAIELTTFVMFYRHFKPSWQMMCAASVYSLYSGFCKGFCTEIFDACKREWERIKVVKEAASNFVFLEARDEISLGGEDIFVEDTTP
ncbi:hypothetical protein BOTNAR_0277g00070 [Botryotinia narcissicola]|uniref:Uncharacterized protein n=1 Tax=Botryotinia narcissicola TaxID=278944 RepID=A0A4Z1IB85_9HELO|nr:hypothetical protein BOTNAR_0277g00070 [Botryotinia narcissicola]